MKFDILLFYLIFIPKMYLCLNKIYKTPQFQLVRSKKYFNKKSINDTLDIIDADNPLDDILDQVDNIGKTVEKDIKEGKPDTYLDDYNKSKAQSENKTKNKPLNSEAELNDNDKFFENVTIFGNENFTCKNDADCNNGYCNKTLSNCTCYAGYVTLSTAAKQNIDDNIDQSQCNYAQKLRFIALFFSLFGLGLEELYIGNYKKALLKFSLIILALIYYLFHECFCKNHSISELKKCSLFILGLFLFLFLMNWIIDIVAFYQNKYCDHFGLKLL